MEVVTSKDIRQGFHGDAEFGGGSFGTETGFLSGTYRWNRSAFTLSASGEHTDHYLDPPVLGNYTNSASADGINAVYDQDLSASDRIHLSFHRKQALISQDQRNTARARLRYQIHPRIWGAVAAEYGSGLPVETNADIDSLIAQYGQQIVDRMNSAPAESIRVFLWTPVLARICGSKKRKPFGCRRRWKTSRTN